MRELGRPVLAAAAVVVCGAVMTILDSTIVNVAIERLAVVFDARLSTIQWVSTGYLLALASVIPLAGWAVDRFGTRRVFMGATAAFVGGSLLCGLAWSAGSLIAFRVLQGLGGGMVMPVGMTILARTAGQDRMGRVMALVGVPMLLAPAVGPVLGGALLDGASWRLIFFINLPVGALALVLAARVLPREAGSRGEPLDVLGLALLSPGLAALVAGLAAPAGGALAHVLWLAAGCLLIAAFARHALRVENPLIDLRIFRDRVVAAATATILLFGAAFFGSLLLLALYYQLARDFSALDTGLVLAAQGVGAMLTMPVAGKLTDRSGAGSVVRFGIVLVIAGTIPFAFVADDDVPGWLLVLGLFLRGAGMGATLMPAMAAAYQALPPEAMARAASALEIVQRAGATLGIALLAVILQHGLTTRVPGFEGTLSTVEDASPAVRAELAEPLTAAAGHTFTWALVLTAVTLIPALLLPRRRPVDVLVDQPDPLEAL
jgi:EmrB/QacA subfamily drug resistance transporter